MKNSYFIVLLLIISSCSLVRRGAESKKKMLPIGGGKGYKHTFKRNTKHYDFIVSDKETFLKALSLAQDNQSIFIEEGTKIDLSHQPTLKIDKSIKIYSQRGIGNSLGALITTSKLGHYPLFYIDAPNVLITGLRLRGPDTLRRIAEMLALAKEGKYYNIPNSCAIRCAKSNLEVENCEIWGWTYAAVHLLPKTQNAYIHHNYIHHNQRLGLGYGVSVQWATALIQANYFDWNRHSVACSGEKGSKYELSYNYVGAHGLQAAFDVHGGVDRKDSTNIAGTLFKIHHNTVFLKEGEPAIIINGIPEKYVKVFNNKFGTYDNLSKAIEQRNGKGKIISKRNTFAK